MSNLSLKPEQTHFNYFSATQIQQERAEPVVTEIQSINSGQSNQLVYGVVPYPSNIPIIVQENGQTNESAGIIYTPTYPYLNPEVIFSQEIKRIKHRRQDLASQVIYHQHSATTSNEVLIALHQLYSEQILDFNGIHFLDNSNALNPSFFQDFILSPLLESNHLIPGETIRNSKLIVAGSLLMELIQTKSRSQLFCSLVGMVIMFVGYSAYLILQSIVDSPNNYLIVPYVILFSLHAAQYILLSTSLKKFRLQFLKLASNLCLICYSFSLLILVGGLFASMPYSMQFIGIHAAISFYMIILNLIGMMKVQLICDSMKRIAVLFKQISEQVILLEDNICC